MMETISSIVIEGELKIHFKATELSNKMMETISSIVIEGARTLFLFLNAY